jgi:hypothetical protein
MCAFRLHLDESKNTLKKNGHPQLSPECNKKVKKQCHNNNQYIEYSYFVNMVHVLRSRIVGIFGQTHFSRRIATMRSTLH